MGTGPRARLKARREAMKPRVSLVEMGRRVDVTDSTIHRWETGESTPYPRHCQGIARGYQWPIEDLAYLLAREDEHGQPEEPIPALSWHHEFVDRRDFLAASAAFATAGILDTDTGPTVIGPEQAEAVDGAVAAMERQDATDGGAHLYTEAVQWRRRVERWLDSGSYTPGVGDHLQSQLGTLSAWAGWLAFDAGAYDLAEHHLHDALTQARLTDDPALEVRSLAAMCLAYTRQERPRMAAQCADTGLRVARGWATPRQVALLHIRRAHAHAWLGERSGFTREITRASGQLDQGEHPDDPLYIHFVGPQELHSMVGRSWLLLDEPDRAVSELRHITDNPDKTRHRNLTLATVTLSRAIAATGDITEASRLGAGLVNAVVGLHSGRTVKDLGELRRTVDPRLGDTTTARDFAEMFDATFAA